MRVPNIISAMEYIDDSLVTESCKKPLRVMPLLISAVAAALFICIAGTLILYPKNQSVTNNIYFPQKNDNNIAASAEFAYAAENLEQLYQYSDTVVIGNIVDEGEIPSEYYYETVSATLEITECIKGDATKGQSITVAEFGVRNEDGTDYSIGGVPLLRTGMKVLLFLEQPKELYENSNEYIYAPLNEYLGKFFYDNNDMIHPAGGFTVTESSDMADYSENISASSESAQKVLELSDFNEPMTEDKVLQKIKEITVGAKSKTNKY